MAVNCDSDDLVRGSACFKCLSTDQRKAILIYILAKTLLGIGYPTDYASNVRQLLIDSRRYGRLAGPQKEAALLRVWWEFGLGLGSPGLVNTKSIISGSKCLECIQDKDAVLLYITCALLADL